MILRFIGIEGEVFNQGLNQFGQSVEVPDAEGKAAIAANLPALPDGDFNAIGFTKDELEKYRYHAARANAPVEFAAKHTAARMRLHEMREQYRKEAGDAAKAKETQAEAEEEVN